MQIFFIKEWKIFLPLEQHDLIKKLELYYRPSKSIHERVDLILSLRKELQGLLQLNPEKYARLPDLIAECEQFLELVFNTENITEELLNDVIAKRKIDYTYLPNHLPDFISEPCENTSRQQFIRKRWCEVLLALGKKSMLDIVELYQTTERLPLAHLGILSYARDPKWIKQDSHHKELVGLAQDFFQENYRITGDFTKIDSLLNKRTPNYFDVEMREKLRTHITDGKFYQIETSSNATNMKPACTINNSSHGKQGWATFVCTHKGEEFQYSHCHGENQHSSCNSAGPLFFAGERKIDAEGKLLALSNCSGHYRPNQEQFKNYVLYLYTHGVDLSQCVIHILNTEASRNWAVALVQKDHGLFDLLLSRKRKTLEELDFIESQYQYDKVPALEFIREYISSTCHPKSAAFKSKLTIG